MTKVMKRLQFQKDMAMLQAYAMGCGINYLVTTWHRTADQQHTLFLAHKSQRDGLEKRSAHQEWLAIDIVIINDDGTLQWDRDERYEKLGAYWKEQRNNTWGGDWQSLNDIYHFELKDALT